jgi:hypothetical protein
MVAWSSTYWERRRRMRDKSYEGREEERKMKGYKKVKSSSIEFLIP